MPRGSNRPGVFITFEGVDGSGKTTQLRLLTDWLHQQGHEVVVSREPGSTKLGAEIRNLVLHSREQIAPRAEALLYAADRAQNVAEVVRPALSRGAIVIQDRYIDSSVAYQGAGRVLEPGDIVKISAWAAESLMPDLTVLLDLPVRTAGARVTAQHGEFDRLESEDAVFHGRVRDAYLRLAHDDPQRFVVLDARESIESIHASIVDKLGEVL